MRIVLLGALALTMSFAEGRSYADKLLGVETEEDTKDDADEEPAAAAPKKSGSTATKRATFGGSERGSAPEAGDFTFSGSLGANNKGVFGGMFGVGYSLNRYVGVDGSYSYHQTQTGDKDGVQYGPALDLVGRLPNPTIVTPYVGVGGGYVKWQRSNEGETFDAGGAATGSLFGGANLHLTRYFGLQLERRQTTFVSDPPKRFDDMTTREPKIRVATNVGFYMKF